MKMKELHAFTHGDLNLRLRMQLSIGSGWTSRPPLEEIRED
jgi:hypothetical protein